jgi:hypothetical protein
LVAALVASGHVRFNGCLCSLSMGVYVRLVSMFAWRTAPFPPRTRPSSQPSSRCRSSSVSVTR